MQLYKLIRTSTKQVLAIGLQEPITKLLSKYKKDVQVQCHYTTDLFKVINEKF